MSSVRDLNQRLLDSDRANAVQRNYEKTLMLLVALKAGQVTVNDFVMTADGGWQLVMEQPVADSLPEPDPLPLPEPTVDVTG